MRPIDEIKAELNHAELNLKACMHEDGGCYSHARWRVDELSCVAADLIESLQAQLAESKRRERAAVEDLKALSESNGDCSMCFHYAKNNSDYVPDCDSCPCDNGFNRWEWRGPVGEGEKE